MDSTMWLSFLSYAITTALSPGPNNILALSVTSNHGIKKNIIFLLGIYSGFSLVMVLCAFFSLAISAMLPNVFAFMKYIGAVYIFWLAQHIVISKPIEVSNKKDSTSFFKGFLLQFVNVKIIIWGLTVFGVFVLPNYHSLFTVIGFIFLAACIGNGATFLWAIAGATFSHILKKYWRVSNAIMALLLVYSAISVIIK